MKEAARQGAAIGEQWTLMSPALWAGAVSLAALAATITAPMFWVRSTETGAYAIVRGFQVRFRDAGYMGSSSSETPMLLAGFAIVLAHLLVLYGSQVSPSGPKGSLGWVLVGCGLLWPAAAWISAALAAHKLSGATDTALLSFSTQPGWGLLLCGGAVLAGGALMLR